MRSFTIEKVTASNGRSINYIGGRFLSETPRQSAGKAFTKVYHHVQTTKTKPFSAKIVIRETTQNSNHKLYTYRVTKKNQKSVVLIDDEEVVFNFITKVKSLN